MNRPIKFRAWDTVSKKYLHPYPDGFHLFGEVMCFDLIEQQLHELRGESYSLLSLNDVVVEQFTGLTDCKGKEIWEGDILSWEAGSDEYDRGHVYYYRGGFYISFEKVPHHSTSEPLADELENYHIEVLGNIHENPDLLKKGATS